MAYVDNSETAKILDIAIRGNAVSNVAPKQVDNKVSPTIEMNPLLMSSNFLSYTDISTSAGSFTFWTGNSGYDFYITGVTASFIKDATCNASDGAIRFTTTVDGKLQDFMNFETITLTAQTQFASVQFARPLKVDSGASVGVSNLTFGAGKSAISATLTGIKIPRQ